MWEKTNALRRGTPQELADADPVLVELAHGSVELSQHALTGTILIEHAVEPIVPLRGLVDLDAEMSPDAPRPMETVDACWGEGLDEKEYSLQGDEKIEENPAGGDGENVKDHDGGDGNAAEYEPSIMGEDEQKESESKCLEKAVGELSQPAKVRHVTLMEPVGSRNVKHVMPAMDALVTRMRCMGVCVTRVRSDRAKELLARKFRSWVAQRSIMHTFTAGDDPQSNAHCEAEVNQLKRRTRLLLHTAGQENTTWPQAMRYATEERLTEATSGAPWFPCSKNVALQFPGFGHKENMA